MAKRSRLPGIADGTEDPENAMARCLGRGRITGSSRKGSAPIKKTKTILEPAIPPRNKFVVAIDFGTTYSGIAFVSTTNCDARDVHVVHEWAGIARQNDHLEKVPSRIAFAHENEGLKTDKWGYEVEPTMKSYTWFKLLLDADATVTKYDSQALSGHMRKGLLEVPTEMNADELATEYLKFLYQHTMDRLSRCHSADIVKVTAVSFWFTHPATWQDAATDATRKAAQKAGFGSRHGDELSMISEPEAAAIAILSHAIDVNPSLYKTKTNIMIADLGGGTLDFQCLTVENLQPLRTEEAIPGIGGKSGSTYIDCNLHEWLKVIFGDAFTRLPRSKVGPGSKFMDEFELVKKMFNGKDPDKLYHIHLPALGKTLRERGSSSASYDFEEFNVLIRGSDLAELFQPVLDNAFGLIEKQVQALRSEKLSPLRVICLCGGLGQSEYVSLKFEEYVSEVIGEDCRLVTDERAWSAVVRGAAVRGLDGSMVIAKRAKRCYGIGVHQDFREGIDKEKDGFICPFKKTKRAEGYVNWVVKRGRRFVPGFKAESKVYAVVDPEDDEDDMVYHWDMYSCAADEAPIRVESKGVVHEGKIELSLSKSYKRQRREVDSDSDEPEVQAANIRVVFRLGDARGTIAVLAMHNKSVVGEATIGYTRSHVRRPVRSAGLL